MSIRVWSALLLWALCGGVQAASAVNLSINDAWLRATPPGAEVGSGYGELRNAGAKPLRIVKITSPVAASVEVHSMSMEGGVMRMRMLDTVRVPAKGVLTLEPGGQHLMLMGLRQPLVAGQTIPLVFKLADGRTVSVQMPVRDAQ